MDLGSGVPDEEIARAEQALGVQIRGGYREFLRCFGWAGIGSVELFGLGADVPRYLELVEHTRSERTECHPRLRRNLVPLLNDGFGNHYCIDTDSEGEPPVVFWNHEAGEEQTPKFEANDFVSWLNELMGRLAD